MSLTVAQPQGAARLRTPVVLQNDSRGVLDLALVNNMPDGALQATERQFSAALQLAASGIAVRLHLFALPATGRSPDSLAHLARHYRDFGELFDRRFDAVIVTGAEPRAARLSDEPYWRDFIRVVDWADRNTLSSVWSCLAAHAAVLHLDGVTRVPTGDKLSGVFASRVTTDGLRGPPGALVHVPHSRYNGLRANDLLSCGYRILSQSDDAGVDVFTMQRRSRLVFLQGHPEYEADTLMREYRRDVGRFLRAERELLPEGASQLLQRRGRNAPARLQAPRAGAP